VYYITVHYITNYYERSFTSDNTLDAIGKA